MQVNLDISEKQKVCDGEDWLQNKIAIPPQHPKLTGQFFLSLIKAVV